MEGDQVVAAPAPAVNGVKPKETLAVSDAGQVERGFIARWVGSASDAVSEWIASRPAGQLMIRSQDRLLRVVEKTLVWSVQPSQTENMDISVEDGVGGVVLVSRPLSWPLFLPFLLVLRVFTASLYVVTLVFGRPQNTQDVIRMIQSRRRRLRAIKYAGIRNMRIRHAQTCSWRYGPFSAVGWFLGLTRGSKPVQDVNEPGSPSDKEKKRKYCEVEQSDWTDDSDDDESLVSQLKLDSSYNSDSDPDFEPGSEAESSSDDDEGEDESKIAQEAQDAEKTPATPKTPGSQSAAQHQDGSVSENGFQVNVSSPMTPPIDKDGIVQRGEFAGSPLPMAAVAKESQSKVARFFVPFSRRSSKDSTASK